MKKLVKGFIIGAAVLIGVGALLVIGGAAAGGMSMASAMLSERVHNTKYYSSSYDIMVFDKTETDYFEASHVRNLEIEAGAAKIWITEGAPDSEAIIVQSDKKWTEAGQSGDTLVINAKHHKNIGVGEGTSLRITVPAGFAFDDVDISTGAATLDITKMNARHFELETGAGETKIQELTADEAEFELGAGKIVVEAGNVRECKTELGAGRFDYEGTISDADGRAYASVDCGMGSAEFRLNGRRTDYNYHVDCNAGSVTIDEKSYAHLGHGEHGENQGFEIDYQAESDFDIDCAMGVVEITFMEGNI